MACLTLIISLAATLAAGHPLEGEATVAPDARGQDQGGDLVQWPVGRRGLSAGSPPRWGEVNTLPVRLLRSAFSLGPR